ncbi:MAG: hypothetical protein ACYTCV_12720, partial [Planctomycetota bacterium]
MKKVERTFCVEVILMFLLFGAPLFAELMDTGFTYQGRLLDVDTQEPVNGECDLQFKLYDDCNPQLCTQIG